MADKIALRVSNHTAYVWNVQDIAALRSKHRICGLLVGTLPHLSQQNVFLGVPLVLMPEEVVLLVDKGFAMLVDDKESHDLPEFEELEGWHERRRQEMNLSATKKRSRKEPGLADKATSEVALAKRKAREAKRAIARENATPLHPGQTPPPMEANPNVILPVVSMNETIPTSSSQFSWYRTEEQTYETLTSAREAGLWTYPSDAHERSRCGVFRALWEKGSYLGCGVKFGGEYLVYPGDPLRYHSHFTASVITDKLSSLRPMEIVAHGRLGTATKKAHLLCTWDEERQCADFYSIEWSGFG